MIIEDDKGAFNNLKNAMRSKNSYELVDFSTNKNDGIAKILEHQPDLIFLDVELGNDNGFDLLSELKNAFYDLPPIIMTTAHDHYGKTAVNNQITYFLSKPIETKELNKALQIFEKKFTSKRNQIFLRTTKGLEAIPYHTIVYLQANEGYTDLYKSTGEKITIPKTLKHFETQLNENFERVHRSFIANTTKIKEIRLTERELILAENGNNFTVLIGKEHVQKLKNRLKI